MKYTVHMHYEKEDGTEDFIIFNGGINAVSERHAQLKAKHKLRLEFSHLKIKRITEFIVSPYSDLDADHDYICHCFDTLAEIDTKKLKIPLEAF